MPWWVRFARTAMPRSSRRGMCARNAAAKPKTSTPSAAKGRFIPTPPCTTPRPGLKKRPLHRGAGQAGRRPDGHRAADRPGRAAGADRHAGGDGHPQDPLGWRRAGCWCTGISSGRCWQPPPEFLLKNELPSVSGGRFCWIYGEKSIIITDEVFQRNPGEL